MRHLRSFLNEVIEDSEMVLQTRSHHPINEHQIAEAKARLNLSRSIIDKYFKSDYINETIK